MLAYAAVATDSRQSELLQHLKALLREGGNYNRLLVSCGPSYLHFIGRRGAQDLDCEAVCNRFLPDAAKLTPKREALLAGRGFGPQTKRRNPVRKLSVKDERELPAIADEALEILRLAYMISDDEALDFELHLGDQETTRNVPLLRSMKKLARLRDNPSRQTVYNGLLQSELLMPLKADADAALREPHTVEYLQGFPVYAAFSDWTALRLWEPRGWPYTRISGAELFLLAADRKAGSLMINPKGDIGGELLMNEIAALAEVARRRVN